LSQIIPNIKLTTENTNVIKPSIKRRKFFTYAGALALGIFSISKIPFNFFGSNNSEKKVAIKIERNPLAVERRKRAGDNG